MWCFEQADLLFARYGGSSATRAQSDLTVSTTIGRATTYENLAAERGNEAEKRAAQELVEQTRHLITYNDLLYRETRERAKEAKFALLAGAAEAVPRVATVSEAMKDVVSHMERRDAQTAQLHQACRDVVAKARRNSNSADADVLVSAVVSACKAAGK